MSWCWFAHLPSPEPPAEDLSEALASAAVADQGGRPAGLVAAWPEGRKPVRGAVRMDRRLVDPGGPAAWLSLVLVPPELAPLFDDPAVSQAMRRVLAGPPFAASSTLVRDAVHLAGSVTVEQGPDPRRLADDPFALLHPARVLRVGPGMFGAVPPPPGPVIQRYDGKPWPVAGFDSNRIRVP
jgi:hypothetical protein